MVISKAWLLSLSACRQRRDVNRETPSRTVQGGRDLGDLPGAPRGLDGGCASCTKDGNHLLSPSDCIRVQLKLFLPLHLLPDWKFQVPHCSYVRAKRYFSHFNSDLLSSYSNWSLISLIRSWWGSDSAGAVLQKDQRQNCRQDPRPALPPANHMPVIKFLISRGSSSLICELAVSLIYLSLPALEEQKVVSWDP